MNSPARLARSVCMMQKALTELARSFSLKDGEIKTKLAGRNVAHAPSFTELLAPERRAVIFQLTAADSEANARMMKALLAFNAALDQSAPNEDNLIALGQEFIKGDGDAMRTYRQVYVASKFVKKGVALATVVVLMDQAATGVEAALNVPSATLAVQVEELAMRAPPQSSRAERLKCPMRRGLPCRACCAAALKTSPASPYSISTSPLKQSCACVAR